jgi:glucose-1-phosphate cytidylyltransferase
MTTVQPPGRFGIVKTKGDKILNFLEKPVGNGAWINGGFFVLNKKILKLIKDDMTIWEKKPLEILAKKRELISFKHKDFWHPMDTLRDKQYLEDLWQEKNCPWKLWNE